MITKEKFKDLLENLYKKSQANQVNWRKDHDNSFEVHFPSGAVISVSARFPESAPDIAGAILLIDNEVIAKIIANDGDEDYFFLKSLVDEAHRTVVGWDTAISQIEAELSSEGEVGVPLSADDEVAF